MAPRPLITWTRSLPEELTPALRDRRRSLAGFATGRVLDLGGWDDHLDAYAVDDLTILDRATVLSDFADDPRFDTVVSLVRTPLVDDLATFAATLEQVLAAGGHLLFLEPGRQQRSLRAAFSAFNSIARAPSGVRFDHNVPGAIRAAGLFVGDLHRFDLDSVPRAFRAFVEGRARRETPWTEGRGP